MLRTICAYTLLMLALAFVGTALARPETAGTEARQLPKFESMGLPIAPAQIPAGASSISAAAVLDTP